MKELHLTKNDFTIDWFSGSGAGGQHRNKHQNCCRITHIESGLKAQGTESRKRSENLKTAFNRLAQLILARHNDSEQQDKPISNEVIRNYHGVRNEVLDKSSGQVGLYKSVVIDGDLGPMIEARRMTVLGE